MQMNGAEKVVEKVLQSWCSLCAPSRVLRGERREAYAITDAIKKPILIEQKKQSILKVDKICV